jgi:hypothetical protein
MEVTVYGKAEYTCEFVRDLQILLRGELRLWRILLVSNAFDDLILIYPEAVRNNDAAVGESLQETLDRVNAHSQAWNGLLGRYLASEVRGYVQPAQPPRLSQTKVVYNSSPDENDRSWPKFNTIENPPEVTVEEYLEIDKDLVSALERYGPVITKSDLSDTTKTKLNALWLVRTTAIQWDRTRILVKYGRQQFSSEIVSAIQSVLQRWPLWRVALDAEDERDVRFVHPELVR